MTIFFRDYQKYVGSRNVLNHIQFTNILYIALFKYDHRSTSQLLDIIKYYV